MSPGPSALVPVLSLSLCLMAGCGTKTNRRVIGVPQIDSLDLPPSAPRAPSPVSWACSTDELYWAVEDRGTLPILKVRATGARTISPEEILCVLEPFKDGLHLELEGHFRLDGTLTLEGFNRLVLNGNGSALFEQVRVTGNAASLHLLHVRGAHVRGLHLLGSGARRNDGVVAQQVGLLIERSQDILVEDCGFGSATPGGAVKFGVFVLDGSSNVHLRRNKFVRTGSAGVMIGSGIWPHPTDPAIFDGHSCNRIVIESNFFHMVGTGIAIDDASQFVWIFDNDVWNYFGNGMTLEDGSRGFLIAGNRIGPGRGPAVVIGHGQTRVFAGQGVILFNTAAGVNTPLIEPPDGHYFTVAPKRLPFDVGGVKSVHLAGNAAQ